MFSSPTYAIDPKLKVVATMSGYGVVGGALLGTASLAFGASGRAIAKGASLGLYAGLLFGAYVITSYELKKRGYGNDSKVEDYYPESSGPYENSSGSYNIKLDDLKLVSDDIKKDPKKDPLFSMNFFSVQF